MYGYKVTGYEIIRVLNTIALYFDEENYMYAKKNLLIPFESMLSSTYLPNNYNYMKNWLINTETWHDYIEFVNKVCKPGYYAKYIDPEKQELGFIIYDDEFEQLTPEAQKLYLELEED